MDALLQLNQSGSMDQSAYTKQNDILRRTSKTASSFNAELEKTGDNVDELSAKDLQKEKQKKKLMDACIESESLFVNQMLKQMRNTIHKGEILNGGQTEEIFTDMLYDQYSLNISKNANLGLAKQMYDQLSKAL
jgi:peptidoglycan hydrolase FlgJ